MKRKLSILVAVIVIITMVFGITGCSKTSETGNNTQKEITINFPSIWVGKDSKANIMAELITKFNEDNAGSIKVVVEDIADYDAYEDKMTTSIAAGSIPDIFITKSGSKAEPFFKSGKLLDLTSYMNEGWDKQFIEGSLQTVMYDHKLQAVPYEFGVTPVLYNSKILKEVGYDEFPSTYSEFFEMCEALKEKGLAANSQMTADNAWTSMLWYSQVLHSVGGPDVYNKGLDDPAYLEAAKIMKKMFDYTTNDAVGAKASVAAGHFLNERTATLMNGPWFIGRIKSEGINDLYNNTAVAPAPYYEGGKGKKGGYVGFVQANICASKQSDKAKEEAIVKFLKYLTDPENVKKISMESGAMFVIKTNVNENDNIERLQGQMMKQSSEAPYVVPHFNMSVPASIATEFPQALSALVLDDITPQEFIEMLKSAE